MTADIVIADDGIDFTGRTPDARPLGGAESAVVRAAEALAARGHAVRAFTNTQEPAFTRAGVAWAPIHAGGAYAALPDACDLYIANRGDRLIDKVPRARRRAFWIHNPARYIAKWRYVRRLWARRPVIVFIGDDHAANCAKWIPSGGRKTIPYGVDELFRSGEPSPDAPPPPRAIFTSNPLRGLDWLLELWRDEIYPHVPGAELHIYAGAATYGAAGAAKADAMAQVLSLARSAPGAVLHDPVPKAELAGALRAARVMLYRGDENETYCAALAEAQAMGVPCVVERHGSTPERVADGVTGAVADSPAAFAEAARRILTDDALWRSYHAAALLRQRAWSWDDAAQAFEDLL
ncbi:MAG: glycosyltransferase [Rhodospirillales bacterium]